MKQMLEQLMGAGKGWLNDGGDTRKAQMLSLIHIFIDGAAGVGGGDDACAEGHRLLDGVLGHVARARHRDPQAIEGLAAMGQHGVDKVEQLSLIHI